MDNKKITYGQAKKHVDENIDENFPPLGPGPFNTKYSHVNFADILKKINEEDSNELIKQRDEKIKDLEKKIEGLILEHKQQVQSILQSHQQQIEMLMGKLNEHNNTIIDSREQQKEQVQNRQNV